ncbi:MAG: hypothetical protein MPJ24_09385 [Pirellulaceae bacterium]|nr:hypothetical protein [Pirellulaceae bacterium]
MVKSLTQGSFVEDPPETLDEIIKFTNDCVGITDSPETLGEIIKLTNDSVGVTSK